MWSFQELGYLYPSHDKPPSWTIIVCVIVEIYNFSDVKNTNKRYTCDHFVIDKNAGNARPKKKLQGMWSIFD